MQAIAAARFGGSSVDEGSLVGLEEGGGGGGIGSVGSGMTYIHKLRRAFVKPTSSSIVEFNFRVVGRIVTIENDQTGTRELVRLRHRIGSLTARD